MWAQSLPEDELNTCISEFVDLWAFAVQNVTSADELRALLQHVRRLWRLETRTHAEDTDTAADTARSFTESPTTGKHAARINDASVQQQAAVFTEVSSVSRTQIKDESRIQWQRLKDAEARIRHLTSSQMVAAATGAAWASLCLCGGFKLIASCMLTGE